jgi:hypothetical protein
MAMESRVYIDESGGPDTPTFVLGGYIGDVEIWKGFSDEWSEILNREPVMPPLHMTDVTAPKNGWNLLTPDKRRKRLLALVDVIGKYRPHCVCAEISSEAFRRQVTAKLPPKQELIRDARPLTYLYGYTACVLAAQMVGLEDHINKPLGQITLVFDYQEQFRKEIRHQIENGLRPTLNAHYPHLADRYGGAPLWPKPDERGDFVPLQAADMFVWHRRRCRDHPDGERRPIYRALLNASKPRLVQITEDHLRRHVTDGLIDQMRKAVES